MRSNDYKLLPYNRYLSGQGLQRFGTNIDKLMHLYTVFNAHPDKTITAIIIFA